MHSWTKNAFWGVSYMKWRKCSKFVSLFLFNNTYGLPVLSMNTNGPNQVFYVWLVDTQTICANWGLETWHFRNNYICICLLDRKYCWVKTRFETWITRNDVRGICLFNLPYWITPMAYLCSRRKRNVQIKYFLFHWSIYRIFSKYGLETWFAPNDEYS
jgi:hypothetical protein